METKHTPGPWAYTKEDQVVHLPGDYSKMIADIRGRGWLQKLPNGAEVQDANGKLIAAAPELLKACIEALKHHQGGHSEIGYMLHQAIKKATGND